ncbi:MAG TPA: single-stranded DNA-binding protein [Firmicutes bacterium]|nr:single-stranded DNA-binding protein [Bacillota bacterium]
MANLNRVFLMGNLTRDLELKYGKNGQPVTNMRLAVNRAYTTQTGEKKEEVCFVNIVVWGKQAESCHTYLVKGSAVFIEGRLQSRSWDAEDGTKKSILEVVADRVQFIDRKKKGDDEYSGDADASAPGGAGNDDAPF